jgi:capsular polysaccharide biosynthesis protein
MRAKVTKAFLTVISALLISEAFFLVIHFVIADKYQRMTENLVSEYRLSKKTSELVDSFYDLIQYSNDQQRISAFNDNLNGLQALLAKLDKDLAGRDSWTLYLGTKNTISVVIDEVNNGVKNISAGNFSEVTAGYLTATKYNNFVRENTSNLVLKELEIAAEAQTELTQTKFWSELTSLVLFSAIALGCVLYAFSFSKQLEENAQAARTQKAMAAPEPRTDDQGKNDKI